MDNITSGSVKKTEKLLEAGLDPNFTTEDGSKLNILMDGHVLNKSLAVIQRYYTG